MHSLSNRTNTRAFTLLELLVVIAIIGTLASLLFPVTAKVIDQLHGVKCNNNLRQLGMIIRTSAGDNANGYPRIENDPQNPIHTEEDGKIWTLPELVKAYGGSADILKCPADLRSKLAQPKSSTEGMSYYEAKGSSYEWYPYYEGENINAPRRLTGRGGDNFRVIPPNRVRLLMDYAESGEAPHDRSPESSTMHSVYADGSVRKVVLVKQ